MSLVTRYTSASALFQPDLRGYSNPPLNPSSVPSGLVLYFGISFASAVHLRYGSAAPLQPGELCEIISHLVSQVASDVYLGYYLSSLPRHCVVASLRLCSTKSTCDKPLTQRFRDAALKRFSFHHTAATIEHRKTFPNRPVQRDHRIGEVD